MYVFQQINLDIVISDDMVKIIDTNLNQKAMKAAFVLAKIPLEFFLDLTC